MEEPPIRLKEQRIVQQPIHLWVPEMLWVDLGFCLSADRNALGFGNYAICPNRPAIRLSVSFIETRESPVLYATPSVSGEIATPTMQPGVGDDGRGFDRRIATPLRMRAPTRPRSRPPTGGRYGRIA
jgi:hypothetical protein